MDKVIPDGARISHLRKKHPRYSKQVDFARAIGIPDRQLRKHEKDDQPIEIARLKLIGEFLKVHWQELVQKLRSAPATTQEPEIVPRHDTTYAQVVKEERTLYERATGSDRLEARIMTSLSDECSQNAEELGCSASSFAARTGSMFQIRISRVGAASGISWSISRATMCGSMQTTK